MSSSLINGVQRRREGVGVRHVRGATGHATACRAGAAAGYGPPDAAAVERPVLKSVVAGCFLFVVEFVNCQPSLS